MTTIDTKSLRKIVADDDILVGDVHLILRSLHELLNAYDRVGEVTRERDAANARAERWKARAVDLYTVLDSTIGMGEHQETIIKCDSHEVLEMICDRINAIGDLLSAESAAKEPNEA